MDKSEASLFKEIAHGNCFVLVGSGASIDAGYPSWIDLAKQVYVSFQDECDESQKKHLCALLESQDVEKLLLFFDKIEEKVSKIRLVNKIKEIFNSISPKESEIYSIITQWPINYYLTTNYDSEIIKYLNKIGEVFLEKGNTEEDFFSLKVGSEKFVVKIHGSFDAPDSFIISKHDYDVLQNNEDSYWNKKIFSILSMCNLILIGYSVSDPDFSKQLELAKKISSYKKPVYMFATDIDSRRISELYAKYNIKVIPYNNSDKKHSNLKRLLYQYSCFIPKRNSNLIGKTEDFFKDNEIAASLYVYNKTVQQNSELIDIAFHNIILYFLQKGKLNEDELIGKITDNHIANNCCNLKDTCSQLEQNGYIKQDGLYYEITEAGNKIINESKCAYNDTKDRFKVFCFNYLEKKVAKTESKEKIYNHVEKGIGILFQKRGIEIARRFMDYDEDAEISISFDIAYAFEATCTTLTGEEYDYFIDLILTIFQNPSKEIKDYLSVLCNSYFMYHILGHDEKARESRLSFIKNRKVIIDSNVLIPLIAQNCENNEFTKDLIEKLYVHNTELYVTEKIIEEIFSHLNWAIKNFSDKAISDINLFQASKGEFGYRQNLFLQGALKWCNENNCQNFESYLVHCFGEEYDQSQKIRLKIIDNLASFKISILPEQEYKKSSFFTLYEARKNDVIKNRKENNTFRSDLQCETEAELLAISEEMDFIFVTLTSNLKKLDVNKRIRHCHPEYLYHFLVINSNKVKLSNLYECMVSELYNCGFPVVSYELLKKITGTYFNQTNLSFKEIEREQNRSLNEIFSQQLLDEKIENGESFFLYSQYQREASEQMQKQKQEMIQTEKALERKIKENTLSQEQKTDYERLKNKDKIRKKKQQNKKKRRKKK